MKTLLTSFLALSLTGIALAEDASPTPRVKTHDRDTTAPGVSSADQPTNPDADAKLSTKDLKPNPANKAKDNTAHNDRDKTGETLTPEDQSNDPADIQITAQIRRALVGDDKLSTNAKNVKIITAAGGAVTLRGTVNSADERTQIEEKAKAVKGIKELKNQIEVKKS
ncbi:MAG TPA: BON domain-containing protein [Chthoniobacterales bacterium]|jgi:hypothetical protein